MNDAVIALAAVSWAILAAVIRVLWKLGERVSRLEGAQRRDHRES